jgi:hypothetical protein
MKRVRPLLFGAAALALALFVGGCFLTSAQVFVNYSLPNPFEVQGTGAFLRESVDLNTISDYEDHKDKLKGIADVAILGQFVNVSGSGGRVQIYITAGATDLGLEDVAHDATPLWGPGTIGATGSAHVVTWKESAKLFNAAGKSILINEIKGDGSFTLYVIAEGGSSLIRVDKGIIALILNAGV